MGSLINGAAERDSMHWGRLFVSCCSEVECLVPIFFVELMAEDRKKAKLRVEYEKLLFFKQLLQTNTAQFYGGII